MSNAPSSNKDNPERSSGAVSKGVTDLQEQVAALIALTVSERSAPVRKDKWSSSIGWIAAVTALLAAIGSSLGASQSLYMSTQISATQQEINARQRNLDLLGRRGAENSRIGNLYVFNPTLYCGQIPSDDNNKWDAYGRCVFQTPIGQEPTGDFLRIPDDKRIYCLKEIKMCRP